MILTRNYNLSSRQSDRSKMFYMIMVSLSMMAVLHNTVCVANAIELNPFRNSNNNKSNEDQKKIASESEGNNVGNTQQKMQMASDAATGTITTLEPGMEKEPVTCNEIMAKAVVVASEEKELFRQKAVAANELAAKEKQRADELDAKIEQATQEAKSAIIENEAIKLMTDRLLAEAKADSEARERALTDDFNAKTKDMEDQMEELKHHSLRQVESANMDATKTKDAAIKEAKEIQEKVRHEGQKHVESVETQSKQHIKKVESEAKDAINAAMTKAQEIERNARQQSKEEIERIQAETAQTISDALDSAARVRDDALNYAAELEQRTEKEIRTAHHGAESAITDVHRAAQARVSMVEQQHFDEIKAFEDRLEQELELAEWNLGNYTEKMEEKERGLQNTIDGQVKTIQFKDQTIDELKSNIDGLTREHQYWKDFSESNMDELVRLRLREDLCFIVVLLVTVLTAIRLHRWSIPLSLWLILLPFRLLFLPFRISRFLFV